MASLLKLPSQKRGSDVNYVYPEELLIALDEKHPLFGKPDDPYFDKRLLQHIDSADNMKLRASMRSFGVDRSTITVNEIDNAETGESTYEAVDGNQRIRNSRIVNQERSEAGLEPLRVAVRKIKVSREVAKELSVALNAHRESTPLEKGYEIKTLHEVQGLPLEALTPRYTINGRPATKATLENWLELTRLHTDVQRALSDDIIGDTAAREAMRGSPLNRQPEILKLLLEALERGEKLTVARAKEIGEAFRAGREVPPVTKGGEGENEGGKKARKKAGENQGGDGEGNGGNGQGGASGGGNGEGPKNGGSRRPPASRLKALLDHSIFKNEASDREKALLKFLLGEHDRSDAVLLDPLFPRDFDEILYAGLPAEEPAA